MRKIVYNILFIMLLLICSILFTSCDAITAQNITHSDFSSRMNRGPGMNGNQGKNGGPDMDSAPGKNAGPGTNSVQEKIGIPVMNRNKN